MSKKTLLGIVQDILSSMDGDEVNTIFETTESSQVARCVSESYDIILSNSDLQEHIGLFELTPLGPTKPVLMQMPSNASSIEWIKYNRKNSLDDYPQMQPISYLPLDEFVQRMYQLPSQIESDIGSFSHIINNSEIEIYYRNNVPPSWYTTLDDDLLLFDSYDSELESNLQDQNSLAFGKLSPVFQMIDTFVPPLGASKFQLLIQEAKAQAFAELRQVENAKAEKRARKLWIRGQKDSQDISSQQAYGPYDNLANFGRGGRWKRSRWGSK